MDQRQTLTAKTIVNEWSQACLLYTSLKSLPLDLLKEKMTELSEKPFRAKQLYDWMHVKLAGDYDEMTNLSAALRNRLKEEYPLTTLRVVREQTSAIDGTKKFLFALPDGNLVESVWMQYKHCLLYTSQSAVPRRTGCKTVFQKQTGSSWLDHAGRYVCLFLYRRSGKPLRTG